MGFRELCGLELQAYAIGLSRARRKANYVRATALSIPFRDSSFDLVFASGVLIHINPCEITAVMKEM